MAARRERPASTTVSVRLGVPGLDELWGGGLTPGASVALSGPAQSGKTWFAVQFLLAGAERGDVVLYAKVSQRKEARETLPLAGRLADLEKSGRVTLHNERPIDRSRRGSARGSSVTVPRCGSRSK